MMKKRMTALLLLMLLLLCDTAFAARATLNQPMATRSGPGTKYSEELGTLPMTTDVTVIEMVETGGTWWCMVEFRHNGKYYRAYTGRKRLDFIGDAPEGKYDYAEDKTTASADVYYGPGAQYAKQKKAIAKNTAVRVYDVDGAWALCDYKPGSKWVRGYISTDALAATVAGAVRTPVPTPVITPTPPPREAFNIIDRENKICIDYYGNEYCYRGHDEQFALLVGSLPVMSYFDGVPCVKRSDVYSGPGTYYWRRYNRNGTYTYTGTLDKNLRIYGKENGWMLIRYPSDANSGYRYGWTALSAISPSHQARVPDTEFARVPAITTRFIDATDDPDMTIEYIGTSATANIRVTALAFLDESRSWVYCEYSLQEGGSFYEFCRGFLPANGMRVE